MAASGYGPRLDGETSGGRVADGCVALEWLLCAISGPIPTTVEIRKADVGRSRSVKLRTPHASIDDNMADTCDEVITIRLARDGSAACRGGSGKVTHKDWNLGPAGYI